MMIFRRITVYTLLSIIFIQAVASGDIMRIIISLMITSTSSTILEMIERGENSNEENDT